MSGCWSCVQRRDIDHVMTCRNETSKRSPAHTVFEAGQDFISLLVYSLETRTRAPESFHRVRFYKLELNLSPFRVVELQNL